MKKISRNAINNAINSNTYNPVRHMKPVLTCHLDEPIHQEPQNSAAEVLHRISV